MTGLITKDPGLSVYFTVVLDGTDLGPWATCSGLGMEIETEEYGDSAMGVLMSHLPGRVKYSNLVLGRPISPDTAKVMAWLSSFAMLPVTTAAEVTALDTSGATVMSWSLFGVMPVKWTGPSFDTANLQLATEQLELAYKGFL